MIYEGHVVVDRIDDAHPKMPDYPLLPGDLLTYRIIGYSREGTMEEQPIADPVYGWAKEAPGLCVIGLVLTDEQIASLKPVRYEMLSYLNYRILS